MAKAAGQARASEVLPGSQTVTSDADMRDRMQAGIDALADGFVLWDKDDRLRVYNDAFRREYAVLEGSKLGRSFEELLSEYAHSGAVPSLRGREDAWVREQVEARGGELDQEILYQSPDGRWMLRRDRLTATGDRVGIRTDVTEIKRREEELAEANRRAEHLVADFEHTLNTLRMGVVLLDPNLEAEIINKAFYDLWKLDRDAVKVGDHFRTLMDVNRHNGIYDVTESRWEEYVGRRIAEIRAGNVEPREFHRADGSTLIYSVTSLSGGKRLVCYYDVTDMKQREAALNVAIERMGLADAVINAVKDPIFVKDQDLRFVFVNKAFAAMFDRLPGEVLGLTVGELASPEEAELFEASERRVLETGETYETEEDFESRGIGRSRLVRKNLVSTDSGNTYVSGFVFDVTEIRRRQREAEQARSQLAHVLETLPAGVVIYDKDDRFVLSNRNIHESLPAIAHLMQPGCPLRPAIEEGRKVGYFRHTDDPELDALYNTDPEAWLEGYIKRYHTDQHVSERKNADGRWFQVYDTRTKDGLFVGVRVDITELKERETALKESMRDNELFRSLIDSVPVAIYAKRPDLSILYVNQGWSDLTGIPKESAIGHTDAEVFGPDGEIFMESDRKVLESGELLEIQEVATAADGSIRHQIARKGLMTASDGSLYLIGSSSDVTEMKRREEELRAAEQRAVLADRAKSEFLANMSHEIRTPMNGVLGMAELLAKTELNQKQKTFTDIIVKSGNALLTIINDILDFSKIDAGQLVLDPAPFHLGESVEDVATLMATRAKEKDLELIVRVDPELPRTVVGDAGRLRQIVTNLVGNAVKFTDSGHVLVDVSGEAQDESVKLRFKVTDTGIGIPADKLDHVFEKFSQVDASSTRRHEGTGLGLAITSRLVALMGGEIGVESEFGKGSTFWFDVLLPLGEAETRRKATPHDVTGARVLVVDDNAVNRAILMEQMNAWGFDACAAESGPEALAVLKETARLGVRVDCVVLDYQMPGVSGSDVAAAMRTVPALAHTPIIMLTSVDQSLSLAQNRDLGIGTQLIKPARSSALLEALVSHIQQHHDDIAVTAPSARPAEQAPVAQEPRRPAAAEEAAPAAIVSPAGHPERQSRRLDILVAEDNEVNQLVFAQILSDTPYSFEIVRNGRLAVEAHAEMRPGMILMDVSMPEMNGLEATNAIREAEGEGNHVPIVGVTAHALKGDRERCLSAGMDDYMSKPISPNMLLEKIHRWLDAPEKALHRTA
ncbi:response regulator [Aquibium oceanicum]|uniref:response regulator n=1 Tax=Aquibium oceanicum TaxID=1670800 RepID=UPI003612E2D2